MRVPDDDHDGYDTDDLTDTTPRPRRTRHRRSRHRRRRRQHRSRRRDDSQEAGRREAGGQDRSDNAQEGRRRCVRPGTAQAGVHPVIAAAVMATALALTPPPPPAARAPYATISIPAIGLHARCARGSRSACSTSVPATIRAPGARRPAGRRDRRPPRHAHATVPAHHELKRGQLIVLTRRSRRFVYRVSAMRVVDPTDVWPIRMHPTVQRLVLTACHPPRGDLYRLVVFARLVDADAA